MNRPLHPPLALIERELFGQDTLGVTGYDAFDPALPLASPGPAMPAQLLAIVERKVAATHVDPSTPLAVGQIRSLAAVPAEAGRLARQRSCAILLGRWVGERRWAGWIVAQEVDYATDRDLVLQEDDGIIAPEAAIVQTWNPLELEVTGKETLLGKVSAETLAAVLKLSAPREAEGYEVASRPGRIGAWDLDAETTVVTGTPLGEDDPRSAYRELYGKLAAELARTGAATRDGPKGAGTQPAPGWRAWLQNTFVRPAWTFGALALLLGQSAWMLGSRPTGIDEGERYRGVAMAPQSSACRTTLRVVFRLDTPYAELVLALRRADATLAGGPSETGEIWILPPPDQNPAEAAAMLRQQHVVERVDVVLPEAQACRR